MKYDAKSSFDDDDNDSNASNATISSSNDHSLSVFCDTLCLFVSLSVRFRNFPSWFLKTILQNSFRKSQPFLSLFAFFTIHQLIFRHICHWLRHTLIEYGEFDAKGIAMRQLRLNLYRKLSYHDLLFGCSCIVIINQIYKRHCFCAMVTACLQTNLRQTMCVLVRGPISECKEIQHQKRERNWTKTSRIHRFTLGI